MGNFNSRGRGIDKKYNATAFSVKELLNHLGENPRCYLTGEAIDLSKGETYSFDHIVPVSKGGLNTLSNLGLCLREINCAKADRTVEEFLYLCSVVLNYNRKL
jgi:CRISPR/Cas system Type II protein with McrA/HNH and RuvC-like nuclease domain